MIFTLDSGKTWTPPPGWTGPDAALYRSFDNMIGLIYMEGTQQRNYTPLVAGKVNYQFIVCALGVNSVSGCVTQCDNWTSYKNNGPLS